MANNAAAFQPGQQPGAEPSMEEILASIRRIIADDSLGTKKDETPAAAPPPPRRLRLPWSSLRKIPTRMCSILPRWVISPSRNPMT